MTLLFGSVNLGETGLAEAFLELDLERYPNGLNRLGDSRIS